MNEKIIEDFMQYSYARNLSKLRGCPNCGSRNYKEEIITYKKR